MTKFNVFAVLWNGAFLIFDMAMFGFDMSRGLYVLAGLMAVLAVIQFLFLLRALDRLLHTT